MILTYSTVEALAPKKSMTQYKLNTWQRERGLDHQSVVSICQSNDGYLWLGTFRGLVRFDGFEFKTFNTDNTKELPDNFIWTLLKDDNKLWIGTKRGLSSYSNGVFKRYPTEEFPEVEIFTIIICRSKGLWIGTARNGLMLYRDNRTTLFSNKEGLTSNQIRAIYEDIDGTLWLGTPDGLFVSRPTSKRRFSKYLGKKGPFSKSINALFRTKSGEFWAGCGDGLYKMKDKDFEYFSTDLPNPDVMRLYEDSNRNLWAGTDGYGLIRIKKKGIERLPSNHRRASDYIYAIFEDKEENLWLGSEGEGLHRLRDTLFTQFTTFEGLNHNDVNCIHLDRDGTLLIGTAVGVNLQKNGKLSTGWKQKKGLLSSNVRTILKDSRGYTWIGTDRGFNRYKNGKLSPIDDPNVYNTYNNNYMMQIAEDHEGAVWLLSQQNLGRFYNGKYEKIKKIGNMKFWRLYVNQNSTIRVSTYGGGLYTVKNGKISISKQEIPLMLSLVESVYEDWRGTLYIATHDGLRILIDGEIFKITTKHGLIDNWIRHIAEDNSGYIWVTDRLQYLRIKKKELLAVARGKKKMVNPMIFNDLHGLQTPYCSDWLKTADGRLWFATDKGLAMVDPAKIYNQRPTPLLKLEEVIIDGEPNILGDTQYDKKNPFIIPAGTQRIEFEYTAISFINPSKIKFKYKLDNYDEEWKKRGTIRNISFNNLKPSTYTFKVKLEYPNGQNNTDEDKNSVSMTFKLKAFFYETSLFYFVLAMFILIATFSIYRLRIIQLKNRQKELAREVTVRTKEVQEKNRQLELQSEKLKELDQTKSRFFANISHEFRTPLTLITGPLEQMIELCNENEFDRKRKLILMLRNAQRLLRLINQLLDLSRLDSGKMKLNKVSTGIISFVHGITESFLYLAQQKDLALVFHSDFGDNNDDLIVKIDHRKVEDIMSNLLINAIKFTPPGGEIQVTVKSGPSKDETFPDGSVQVTVADTGPGIPVPQLPYVFDRFYQADATYEHHPKGTGIGLALCKELVELHGGTIDAMNHENGGTKFILALPMGMPTSDDNKWETGPFAIAMTKDISDLFMDSQESPEHKCTIPEEKDEKNIILVVDDSADMREYIRVALEPEYLVEEAANGEEGIQKARSMIPDLILSDIMMPVKDGNELCRTIKSEMNTSHVPVILLTAKASEENIIEGLETGADDYITKPFSTAILNARIKNLIDLRSQLQQNFKRELSLRPVKTSVSTLDEEFLKELHTLLKKNIAEPDFNVEEMCKQLYMSGTTLYRKIQALCGMTPTEFIRSYRLKQAAQLLKSGFGSVTEVAFEVGFSSRAYFTKCFKEKFNQLPSEVECEG